MKKRFVAVLLLAVMALTISAYASTRASVIQPIDEILIRLVHWNHPFSRSRIITIEYGNFGHAVRKIFQNYSCFSRDI